MRLSNTLTNSHEQVLESVSIKGSLQGLCLIYEVVQIFANSSKRNIEAVYTFPLPQGAVLMDLKIKLGDKLLSGTVITKEQAVDQYETAISEGNSAIMLERTDDGICTVNVGNLLAGERSELRYRYSQLLNWQNDSLRITLPTNIAPRYGDPVEAGWHLHQTINQSELVEYPFSYTLEIEQPLASALVECPTHEIAITRHDGKAKVTLSASKAWLDRDLVLNLTLQGSDKNTGMIESDRNSFVTLASFSPVIPGDEVTSACVKIVVDCSGSMQGASIEQAKLGLLRILDNLRETDTFNIVRFGSSVKAYFPECVPAKGRALRMARQAVETMDADLGGTEMGNALDFAYQLQNKGNQAASVLLITDGEIHGHKAIIKSAEISKHRVFSIGVGNAVAEGFLRGIAQKTGGASELVSPNEGMATAIYRQFRRIYQPRAIAASIQWPSHALWQSPENISAVYSGDTLHIFAGFEHPPEGEAILQLTLEDGKKIQQTVTLQTNQSAKIELARMAASKRIEALADSNNEVPATSLAVEYQLMSRYTNYFIFAERAESMRPTTVPEFTTVDQMLFSSRSRQTGFGMPMFSRKSSADMSYSRSISSGICFCYNSLEEEFMPQLQNTEQLILLVINTSDDWLKTFNHHLMETLPDELADTLERLVKDEGWTDRVVKAALLLAMLNQIEGNISVAKKLNITATLKTECTDEFIIKFFEDSLTLNEDGWRWDSVYELMPLFG
jgi:Ca-activated chloride channel family protein